MRRVIAILLLALYVVLSAHASCDAVQVPPMLFLGPQKSPEQGHAVAESRAPKRQGAASPLRGR